MVEKSGWPLHLVQDPSRQPRYASSTEDFTREVLVGDHLEDIVILPGGLEALGLGEASALPSWLTVALDGSRTVLQFLRQLDRQALAVHKAALEYVDDYGVQREALPRPYPYCLWDDPDSSDEAAGAGGSAAPPLPEAWRSLRKRRAAAEALVRRGEADPAGFYVCELRRLREGDTAAGNRPSKSVTYRHVRDAFGDLSKWTLYWNCYDDGMFVGGFGSGKGLHVDQVLWSNIGKQWRGYKLLAVWPAGVVSAEVVASLTDAHFRPPLARPQIAALEMSAKIALLRPGDIFICSGGVAHASLCVSNDLSVTAYESLVTLGGRHVAQFLQTGSLAGPAPMERGIMEQEDLQHLQSGVAQRFLHLLRQAPTDTEQASTCCLGTGAECTAGNALLFNDLRNCLACAGRELLAHPGYASQMPVPQTLEAVDRISPAASDLDGSLAKRRRCLTHCAGAGDAEQCADAMSSPASSSPSSPASSSSKSSSISDSSGTL